MTIQCSRDYNLNILGCPVPTPVTYAWPPAYDSRYQASNFPDIVDCASLGTSQYSVVPTSSVNGNGIRIADLSVNPGVLLSNLNWPGGIVPKFHWASYYDYDRAKIIVMMHLQGASDAIGWYDPVAGYETSFNITDVTVNLPSNAEFLRLRGQSNRVIARAKAFGGTTHWFYLIDTNTRALLNKYSVANLQDAQRSTFCCPITSICSQHSAGGLQYFDYQTGTLGNHHVIAGVYHPVFIDSINKVICWFGSSPTISLKIIDTATGAVDTTISAFGAGNIIDANGLARYDFKLDRYIFPIYAGLAADLSRVGVLNPHTLALEVFGLLADFNYYVPNNATADEVTGTIFWRTSGSNWWRFSPII